MKKMLCPPGAVGEVSCILSESADTYKKITQNKIKKKKFIIVNNYEEHLTCKYSNIYIETAKSEANNKTYIMFLGVRVEYTT